MELSNLSNSTRRTAHFLITLLTALAGGELFMLLNLPIPWLLGPMLATLIGANLAKQYYQWPGQVRNTGMIIVGYTIGLSLTGSAMGRWPVSSLPCC